MMVNSMGFLKFSIFCEKSCLSRRPDTSAGYTKNRCFFTRWIQRNPSEKTISSCSLTPRPFFALVGTATLLKRQNAIIPKRIFHQRDPFFLRKKCDQASRCRSQTHFRTCTRNLRFCSVRVKSELFFRQSASRIEMPLAMNTRGAAWCSVAQRRTAWFGVVQGWDGTYLPRPSHDDGKFTQGKLPQIISNIYYMIYNI